MTNSSASILGRLDEAHERQKNQFGEIWKFKEEPRTEGLVIRLAEGIHDKGEKAGQPFPIVEIEQDGGARTSVFANRAKLERLVGEEKPQVGDRVAFGYFGEVQQGADRNPFHDFAVVVDRGEGEPSAAGKDGEQRSAESDDVPF